MKLSYHKIKAVGIFGNATKAERKAILDSFKSGKSNVLVASDLVARGLDLSDITHVINLDVPEDLNEYTHRSGRTGRAGAKGTSITIVTDKEIPLLLKIEKWLALNLMLRPFIKDSSSNQKLKRKQTTIKYYKTLRRLKYDYKIF